MSIAHLAKRPVTYHRHSTSGKDAYGNPQDTWTADASTTNVWLEQTQSTEVTANENTQTSDWLLVDPDPAAGLTGRDRVEVDGDMFEVVGPPHVVHTPRGPHHVEARLAHVDPA